MQRHVVVPGGSGQVGEGIVRALTEAGHRVTVPSRSPDRAEALFDGTDGVHIVEGSLDTADAATALADLVEASAPITDVVTSVGGWWSGPRVGELDPDEWQRVIGIGLGAHFHAANTFLPRLAGDRPTYTLVNGGGALEPVRGSGAVSVSAAAQLMLGRAIATDWADDPVKVTTLVLGTPIITRSRPTGRLGWLTADQVGEAVAAVVAGGAADDVVILNTYEDITALSN